MRRPIVDVKEIGERNFHWPQTSFYSIEDYKSTNDIILVFGEEPSMRWKTYSENIANTLIELGVKKAVTLGAFFGQVAHTLPVPIFGVSDDPTFNSRYNVLPTNYSGPTGITSVVGHELRNSGIETSGLWAAVPHYLSSGGYPKGISALLHKSAEILKIDIDDTGIQSEGAFGHLLGGYDAAYYGYLWADIIGDDLFSRFENEGILSKKVGIDYKNKILSVGGSKDAEEMVQDFLGRKWSDEAFLNQKKLGNS